jgi:hypothetical protein
VLVADGYADATFTSDSGKRLMVAGDTVLLADDYAVASHTATGGAQKVDLDNGMFVDSGGVTYRFLGESKADLDLGAEDFADTGRWAAVAGEAGALYRYVGEGGRGVRVDLGVEDYSDGSRWVKIGGEAGTVYEYIGSGPDDLDLNLQDYGDTALWKKLAGAGGIYVYMGTTATLDLNAVDYTDQAFWKVLLGTEIIPQGYNIPNPDPKGGNSDALAVGIVFAVNDVRSGVEAFIADAELETASLRLDAVRPPCCAPAPRVRPTPRAAASTGRAT